MSSHILKQPPTKQITTIIQQLQTQIHTQGKRDPEQKIILLEHTTMEVGKQFGLVLKVVSIILIAKAIKLTFRKDRFNFKLLQ